MPQLREITHSRIYNNIWGWGDILPDNPKEYKPYCSSRGYERITPEMIDNRKKFIKEYNIYRTRATGCIKKLFYYFDANKYDHDCRAEFYYSIPHQYVLLITPKNLDGDICDRLITDGYVPYNKMFGNYNDTISFVKTYSEEKYNVFRDKQKARKKEVIKLQKENAKRFKKKEITYEEYDKLDLQFISEKLWGCRY